MTAPLQFLLERCSVPARQLGEPGPDAATLEHLLRAATHVPDHGKLVPWRLIVLRGDAKRELSQRLATLGAEKNPEWTEAKLKKEQRRYTFAPVVVAVVACVDPESRIPGQEQLLSAGCVAYNLLLGAQALGYGAQWLTGWACYDRDAASVLELDRHERIISFVHIGTANRDIPPRTRPPLQDVVSTWAP